MSDETLEARVTEQVDEVASVAQPEVRELHDLTVTYIKVAVVLAIVTLIEVAVYYVALQRGVTITVLLALSAAKFSLVVLYFMHLKFENRLLSWVFSGPLLLGAVVVLALMALFGVLVF